MVLFSLYHRRLFFSIVRFYWFCSGFALPLFVIPFLTCFLLYHTFSKNAISYTGTKPYGSKAYKRVIQHFFSFDGPLTQSQPHLRPHMQWDFESPFIVTTVTSSAREAVGICLTPSKTSLSYISSEIITKPCSLAIFIISRKILAEYTAPVGLLGLISTMAFVRGVILFFILSASGCQPHFSSQL